MKSGQFDLPIAKPSDHADSSARLSYKFQRLRERIREAISTGELSGKLPGERQLSRRFRVNAKTLSKALTDLAAEGVLERSVGRGTFVRSSDTPANTPSVPLVDKWLVLCETSAVDSPLLRELRLLCPALQFVSDSAALRPSFLSAFTAVIDLGSTTPDSLLRDLVVRGMTVVRIGTEPGPTATHSVLVDRVFAAYCITRELILLGHRKIATIDRDDRLAERGAKLAVARYGQDTSVEPIEVSSIESAHRAGVTGFIGASRRIGTRIRCELYRIGLLAPRDVSFAAIGACATELPCNGYFVPATEKAKIVAELIRGTHSRPVTVWLSGEYRDVGTIGPATNS